MRTVDAIFKSREDYDSWDKHIEHAEQEEALSPVERACAARGVAFLRDEFGADFISCGWQTRHPFSTWVNNLAPWCLRWLTWFADALRAAKGADGYLGLHGRLLHADTFTEALSVLEVADKFARTGFAFSFDVEVRVSDKPKKPDLRLLHEASQDELFAEVSIQESAAAARKAQETNDAVQHALWAAVPCVHYAGVIHKQLARPRLAALVKQVSAKVAQAQSTGFFQALEIPGVITLGLSADKELLATWAAERDLDVGHCSGPRFEVDEAHRARLKIAREQDQLPRDRPGMLVIKNDWMLLGSSDPGSVIRDIEEQVYEHSHLLFVVVTGAHMGLGADATSMHGQHVYLRRVRHEMMVEKAILLFNEYCKHAVLPKTLTAIYNAFGQ